MPAPMFPRLRTGEFAVAAEAVLWCLVVHPGLRWSSVRNVVSVLNRVARAARRPAAERAERIARIAEGVSRRLSTDPTCLKAGLVAYAVLRRRGVEAALVIGARRLTSQSAGGAASDAALEAHAWIEHDGRVLCGAGGRDAFRELWRVSSVRPEKTP